MLGSSSPLISLVCYRLCPSICAPFGLSSSGNYGSLVPILISTRKSSSSYSNPKTYLFLISSSTLSMSSELDLNIGSVSLIHYYISCRIVSVCCSVLVTCYKVLNEIGRPEFGKIQFIINDPLRWLIPSHRSIYHGPKPALVFKWTHWYIWNLRYFEIYRAIPVIFSNSTLTSEYSELLVMIDITSKV